MKNNESIFRLIEEDDETYLNELYIKFIAKTKKKGYNNCLNCQEEFKPAHKFNKQCPACRKELGYE